MTSTEEFFSELDRRIESPDSPHPKDSKERLRKARVSLAILAAGEPEKFEESLETICSEMGVTLTSP